MACSGLVTLQSNEDLLCVELFFIASTSSILVAKVAHPRS
jgi:hypothetical protein